MTKFEIVMDITITIRVNNGYINNNLAMNIMVASHTFFRC